MANIMDYIDWRGDITFEQSPLNEVDALLMAYVAYVDMRGFVENGDTIHHVAEKFFKKHTEAEILKSTSFIRMAPIVLKKLGESRRYGTLRLSDYVNDVDTKEEQQFSAVTVLMPDSSVYIAYCGTDDTLIGWKEDFNMSFISPVPAQVSALAYLKAAAEKFDGQLHLTGHSKGGNLAVYAAAKCGAALQKRIDTVYNLDGPGFGSDMLKTAGHKAVNDRIRTIVPESSIIGMLLEHEETYEVVKSSQTGVMQHDGLSWQVLGTRFVSSQRDESSRILDTSLKAWLHDLTKEQREEFVNDLFDILGAGDAETVSGYNANRLKNIGAGLKALADMKPEERDRFLSVIYKLLANGGNTVRDAMAASAKNNPIVKTIAELAEKLGQEAEKAEQEKKAKEAKAAAEKAAADPAAAAGAAPAAAEAAPAAQETTPLFPDDVGM